MRILIAEDDPVSRRILEAKLTKWDYEVVVTCDGDEAWSALQAKDAPRIAILDWMMPGVDGVDICRRIRAKSSETYTYIILLTALQREEDLVTGMEAGADDYITKPFKSNELKVRLRAGRRIIALQNDLLTARASLDQAFAELKDTQSQMLQREKMASIGMLAAGVAHEINNPVGFIKSNLGTLKKYMMQLTNYIYAQTDIRRSFDKFVTLDEEIEYIINDIPSLIEESLGGAERVTNIVESLKNFSRIDQVEWKFANLNEGLESTLNMVMNEIKYKAELKMELGAIPEIKCNPGQINQVFMNLLVNAAQSIEKKGTITVRSRQVGDLVQVDISDTGSGIPEEIRARIFEPFFTTKPVGKGTGLGLSISYDIVKKHGGSIEVGSKLGEGTTFSVKLPLAPSE
jgi:two-component system, NtrC family, sensor kinase